MELNEVNMDTDVFSQKKREVDENTLPSSGNCSENKLSSPLNFGKQKQQDLATPKNHHPMLARIQRDLNSPSASLRMRALKALKSPTRSAYAHFDVPHSEQIIISAEERHPPAPRTIQELMRDVVVYVEVRSGEDNRSAGVKKVISALGARINDKLLRGTTHIVFKDGLLSTYKKAKLWSIPIVSILWIEACKHQRHICDPMDYPISNIDRYENPELHQKMKRHRSMQPESECNRRIRLKPATPKECTPRKDALKKAASQNRTETPDSNIKTTDIRNFFKKRSGKSNNCYEVENEQATLIPATSVKEVQSSDNIVIGKGRLENKFFPKSICDIKDDENTATNSKLKSAIEVCGALTPLKVIAEKTDFDTIAEEGNAQIAPFSNVEAFTESEDSRRLIAGSLSKCVADTDSVTPCVPNVRRLNHIRRTLYTPQKMEISQKVSDELAINAPDSLSKNNCTLYTVSSMEETTSVEEIRTPSVTTLGATTLSETKMEMTPLNRNSRLPLVFNSARQPKRRRTLFDVTMDILSQNVQTINNCVAAASLQHVTINSEVRRSSLDTETNTFKIIPTTDASSGADEFTVTCTKKRKLFQPNESQRATPTMADKRRRTLSSFAPQPRETDVLKISTTDRAEIVPNSKSVKRAIRRSSANSDLTKIQKSAPKKRMKRTTPKKKCAENVEVVSPNKVLLPILVCTNMHKEHIDFIRKTIEKLGGYDLAHSVCNRTTHVVSLEPRRTLNMLRALIRGVWILDYNWVLESERAGKWLTEEPHEMKEFSRAVEICRVERQAFGSMYKCELFADIGPFYISMRCGPISKDNLRELISLCGGKVVDHRNRAKYILGDFIRSYDDKIYITPTWILDSVTQMQLQKQTRYEVNLKPRPPLQSKSDHTQTVGAVQARALEQNLVQST